jgi:NMD protein affecting ribosome stability and mRNA decay
MKQSRPQKPSVERRDRLVRPKEHDTYRERSKHKDAVICDDCGLTCYEGRWTRSAPPLGQLNSGLCPACRRIRDRYPAGTVRVRGALDPLREEILGLIRNVEQQETEEHPLERLMDVTEESDAFVVTTTGLHLARCIAGALKRRFHGNVAVRYLEEQNLIYVDVTPPA